MGRLSQPEAEGHSTLTPLISNSLFRNSVTFPALSATASGGPQATLQKPHLKAPLGEQESGRGTAPPTLAIDDVLAGPIEHRETIAHLVEGHIQRTREPVVAIFGGIAYIEP